MEKHGIAILWTFHILFARQARGALREAFFRCYCQDLGFGLLGRQADGLEEASGAGEQAAPWRESAERKAQSGQELRLRLHLVPGVQVTPCQMPF